MSGRRALSFEDYVYRACGLLWDYLGAEVKIETIERVSGLVIIKAVADLSPGANAQLEVFEVVRRTPEGYAHRDKYKYQLLLDGRLVSRCERDPHQHPEMPDHRHLFDGTRVPGRVSLAQMILTVWDQIDVETRRRALARTA